MQERVTDSNVATDTIDYDGPVYCLTVPPHHTVLTRYKGRVTWMGQSEYQFIGFDEATQFPLDHYRFLFSRLRRRAGMRAPLRVRAASNPGGIGHEWVKQRFLEEGEASGRVFVPARLDDNPSLDKREYTASLNELDPITRAQLLEGDWDVAGSAGNFMRDWFQIVDEYPREVERIVRYWDTAATAPIPGQESSADWTVGTLMARLPNGRFIILEVIRFQGNASTVEDVVRNTAMMDGEEVEIAMEQEPGASGKIMMEHYQHRVLAGYYFTPVRSTGPKMTRASAFASMAAARNIDLLRGQWINRWLDELDAFPFGAHDDQVDSGAGAYNHLTIGGEIRPARSSVRNRFSWRS
jgi:predicted phage terminase large subunit-like protein